MALNLLDRYPGYTLAVLRDGVLIPPEDYASEGISLEAQLDKSIVLSAPDIPGGGGRYDVVVYANAETTEGELTFTVMEFTDQTPDEFGTGYVSAGDDLVTAPLPAILPIPVPFTASVAAGWKGAAVYGAKVPI